jgi:hypothetical protein
MIKRIVIDKETPFVRLGGRGFVVRIFVIPGTSSISQPLVTLAGNDGLPPVQDFYARLESEPGPGGGRSYSIHLRVRFTGKIERQGVLKGSLAVNVYAEGATDYTIHPPGG